MRVRQMRRIGGAQLRLWGLDSLIEDVALILSELVTNAIQHGTGPAVDVRLAFLESVVRIEVRSGPAGGVRVRAADPLAENGRGLYLVGALADKWGVDEAGWIWCTLAVTEAEKAA
ncbi:ATP-binding protein [Streptomyces sp. NPDC097610]|uniref:ATP-binding protein n=1 Tax=Streptomyces sp. NPDC097610 TaxID=3157227 RepID=UPI00332811A8